MFFKIFPLCHQIFFDDGASTAVAGTPAPSLSLLSIDHGRCSARSGRRWRLAEPPRRSCCPRHPILLVTVAIITILWPTMAYPVADVGIPYHNRTQVKVNSSRPPPPPWPPPWRMPYQAARCYLPTKGSQETTLVLTSTPSSYCPVMLMSSRLAWQDPTDAQPSGDLPLVYSFPKCSHHSIAQRNWPTQRRKVLYFYFPKKILALSSDVSVGCMYPVD